MESETLQYDYLLFFKSMFYSVLGRVTTFLGKSVVFSYALHRTQNKHGACIGTV